MVCVELGGRFRRTRVILDFRTGRPERIPGMFPFGKKDLGGRNFARQGFDHLWFCGTGSKLSDT